MGIYLQLFGQVTRSFLLLLPLLLIDVLLFYLQIQLPIDRIYSMENILHTVDSTAMLGRPIMADHYMDAGLADSWLSLGHLLIQSMGTGIAGVMP